MGFYIGNYRSDRPIAPIPVIHRISFREAVIRAITFAGTAVLDTGADVSNIPQALVARYGLPVRDWEDARWPDGSVQRCNVYLLEVSVPGLSAAVERFIDYGFEEVIWAGLSLTSGESFSIHPARDRASTTSKSRISESFTARLIHSLIHIKFQTVRKASDI